MNSIQTFLQEASDADVKLYSAAISISDDKYIKGKVLTMLNTLSKQNKSRRELYTKSFNMIMRSM